jgi:hypothetical protein
MNRQTVGVHDRMNLAGQPTLNLAGQATLRAAHFLVIVISQACPVLVHADDGGINRLPPKKREVVDELLK